MTEAEVKRIPETNKRVRMVHTTYFAMYDASGKITREVSASTDVVCPPPLRPEEVGRFIGRGNGATQKVVDGVVVDKTPAEMVELKRKNPRLRFDDGK